MNFMLIILLSAFIGTTLMTIFSYSFSYVFNKQSKEPILLNKLLKSSTWFSKGSINRAAGWVLHYTVGIVFVTIYYLLWNFAGVQPTLFNGSLLGFISGVFGVGTWWIIFKIHRRPPAINKTGFFPHLIVGHIIFGIGATASYLLFLME